jgi:hypothetical protein
MKLNDLKEKIHIIVEITDIFTYFKVSSYGKYLFFSTSKDRLVEIAHDELTNHGFDSAKISTEPTIDKYTKLPTHILCLYYRDDSRLVELEDRYSSEVEERGYDNFRLIKFKTDEETMKPFNRLKKAMEKRLEK